MQVSKELTHMLTNALNLLMVLIASSTKKIELQELNHFLEQAQLDWALNSFNNGIPRRVQRFLSQIKHGQYIELSQKSVDSNGKTIDTMIQRLRVWTMKVS